MRVKRRDILFSVAGFFIGIGIVGLLILSQIMKTPVISLSDNPASRKDWYPQEFRKMVAIGESTTAGGWSTSPDRCWVSALASNINDFQSNKMEFVNVGIGANLISNRSPLYEKSNKPAANERLDKHVISNQPDLLIISYGLNDARGGTPLDLFKEELTNVIHDVRKQIDPLIVLLGPYYMTAFNTLSHPDWNKADLTLFRQYNEVISQVAAIEECLFVDVLAANGETDWMVHYDGIHANDLGHRIIANQIFEVLAQNCSGLAKKTKELEKTSPRWRDESVLKADYGYGRDD
jgi:lysophospholipase L1-like esterase